VAGWLSIGQGPWRPPSFYHSINGHSEVNFSLVKFPAIREILKKRSLLTNIRTVNITGIRPLFVIKPHDTYIARAIIQLFNINVTHAAQTRIANTSHASITLDTMQRTTKNATNGKAYCKNSIKIVLRLTGRTHQTP
jgi:hypothetical protein